MPVSLRSLSDKDILSRTLELTRRERAVTLQVLLHLAEIEKRQLHLKEGFPSMFAYCTNGLRYSESAANLRIRTARCVARFPEVYGMLEANQVNPSTVSQISKILTPENGSEVLARIRNKSQREVEAIVAEYDTRAALPRDRVRTVVVRVPVKETIAPVAGEPSPVTGPTPPAGRDCQEIYRCNSGAFDPPPGQSTAGRQGAVQLEARREFKFTSTPAFERKFEKIRSLVSHRLGPDPTYEQIFELAMDCFLEKEDPTARQERREQRKQKATAGSREQRPHRVTAARARHVPACVRDQVFLRDRGQCSYVSPGGRRCGSRHVLQIDHIQPVARGGASTPDNLRLLCAYHNRLECERLMGRSGPREGPVAARP